VGEEGISTEPLRDHEHWREIVLHSRREVFPASLCERPIDVNGIPLPCTRQSHVQRSSDGLSGCRLRCTPCLDRDRMWGQNTARDTRRVSGPRRSSTGVAPGMLGRIAAASQGDASRIEFGLRSELALFPGDDTGKIASGTQLRTSSVLGDAGGDICRRVVGHVKPASGSHGRRSELTSPVGPRLNRPSWGCTNAKVTDHAQPARLFEQVHRCDHCLRAKKQN
jgi:hypothetical protein